MEESVRMRGRKRKHDVDQGEKKCRGRKRRRRRQNSNSELALIKQPDQPLKKESGGPEIRTRDLCRGVLDRPPLLSTKEKKMPIEMIMPAAAVNKGKENADRDDSARVRVRVYSDSVRRRRRRSATKLPLPPSSGDLLEPEESVPSLFYVYTTLRSFSRLLFLSPFGLEDFVGALNCKEANSLLDYVHLALLQTLRRHFEFIVPDEGPAAATAIRCLSSGNMLLKKYYGTGRGCA